MIQDLRPALARSWRPESAAGSLERWIQVREQEHWGPVPVDLDMLVQVFGASWSFTRFLFFTGRNTAARIDEPLPVEIPVPVLATRLRERIVGADDEQAMEQLRLARNEYMLSALVRWLRQELGPMQLEAALTGLAEATLAVCLEIFGLTPGKLGVEFAVLGMGRLAGREMTFGSDLDLIFLFAGESGNEGVEVSRRVRRFQRHIAAAAPLGALYEVDMRLRPHGTAGALITSVQSFLDHHRAGREVWERQMMTRCRAVHDPHGIGAHVLEQIRPCVYAAHDPATLRTAIFEMRLRVERELGRPRGKFELKRGPGGVMDVDFACHFLQLAHGHRIPALRACSTRATLAAAQQVGLLSQAVSADLSSGYEFLRRLESCLRLFDLKNVSSFAMLPQECEPLARGMGIGGDVQAFLAELGGHAARIRSRFNELLAGE